MFFSKKDILIPNVAGKNNSDFGGGKKNLIQSYCHKFWGKKSCFVGQKKTYPPLQVKLSVPNAYV
jgi:hypothetical protein